MRTVLKYFAGILLQLALLSGAVLGQGWDVLTSPSQANLNSVACVDAQTAVVVGDGRVILRTADGGAELTLIDAGAGDTLYSVTFVNSSVGLATGRDGQILFTQSGGASWNVVQEGWMTIYRAGQMLSPTVGVAVGMNAVFQSIVSRTSDGWQTFTSSVFYVQHEGSGWEGMIRDIHFFDANVGCAAVRIWNGSGAVVRTMDSGVSWTTQFWSDNSVYAIDFPTPTAGYICGANGMLAKSEDAGETWQILPTDAEGTLWDVKFVNADTGWVVGDGGQILRTDDGGETNHLQPNGVTTNLKSVDFVNSAIGYVAGETGTILKTTTGGESSNLPPGAFVRLEPEDDSTYQYAQPGPVLFRWTTAHDPNSDPVEYQLQIHVLNLEFSFTVTDTALSASLDAMWSLGIPVLPVSWSVAATDGIDVTEASNGSGEFTILLPDAAGSEATLPGEFAMSNYPNPFNPTTSISFMLPRSSISTLRVFDVEGREVFRRDLGILPAGPHQLLWNAATLPSGVYISRLETPWGVRSRKMVMIK